MPGRILIADNVATNRIVLKVKLSAASYIVQQAATRSELLTQAAISQPDAILLDGNFDTDRGIDICQELKAHPKTALIPVIILAADFNAADRLAALHAGACDVLEKPLDDDVLLTRVRNTMRVRSVQDELLLREKTAEELGFNDATTQFSHQAQILIVDGGDGSGAEWQKQFSRETPCSITSTPDTRVLDTITYRNISPDIVLIPAQLRSGGDGMLLLAELRSRAETKYAAIILVDNSKPSKSAIAALDMGANEVLSFRTPPAEFAFRLQRQLVRKRKADKLRDTIADGLKLAVTDPLTGLFNRRYAIPHMTRIAKKSNSASSPFAVMVLDLDRFKLINDTFGHAGGDTVLAEVGRRLKENVRNIDLVARIGGEEFLVVMPETGLAAARVAAERLRQIIRDTPVHRPDGKGPINVTTSIGVSIGGIHGGELEPVEAVIERADHALLAAKSTGRNQVTFERSAA